MQFIKTLIALGVIAAGPMASAAAQPAGSDPKVVAVVGATILPMEGPDRLADQTVIIRGDRIEQVGPSKRIKIPAGARTFDARGQTLMPGLVDMHVHLAPTPGNPGDPAQRALAVMLAHGVTTARGMAGSPANLEVRGKVEAAQLPGPRFYAAAPALNDNTVSSADQGREAVRQAKAAEFDLIKSHALSDPAVWQAIADEARAQGLPTAGHVENSVGLDRAMAVGQQVEHLDGVIAEIVKMVAPGADLQWGQVPSPEALAAASKVSDAQLAQLAEKIAAAKSWHVPTLALFEKIADLNTPVDQLVADPNMRYVPKAALQQWASQHGSLKAAGFGEADAAAFVQLRRRIVRAFAQAGVPMMAGSDTAQNFHIWGPGLHDEVRALAAAGLTPMQALRAATVTPRDYFRSLPNGGSALGWKADFGTVKPGARADLILLSGDPSRNLDALTRPTLVIAAGRVYERSALDAMLGKVIADANATPAPSAAANAPPKQVYVMRHLPAGEGVDPDLTKAGAKLAQALPDFLKAGEFKAVFATPYKRTQQTAAPVAAAFGVPVGTYDPRDPDGLLRAIASVPGNVLVIGHSNTVPDLIGRLGGKPPAPVGETDFGTIFRVDSGSKLTKVFELGGIPPVALGPCKVQGLHPSVRCGTIAVAENRADPKSRTIDIHFGVQPAAAVAVDDPIVMLPGGPGLGGLQSGPGTDQMFGSIMKDRDLLMIDQRGTGHSNPLQCPQVEDDEDPLGQLNESTPTEVTTCRDALLKKADLRFYHTREAVKDMEIVRAALGYQKLDLFGMSYGTRPALDYLRLYPNRVGETVIRAAAPSEMKLPLYSARDIQTSFDRMVEACMEQAPCAARHPDLKGDLQSLLTTLEKAPARISIKDPRNGKTLNGKLSRDGLGTVMFAMLYIPEFYSQLPALIGRAKEGNFSPLVQAASPFLIGVGDQVAWGMRWSVVCDEDVRRIGAKEIPAATRNTFIGDKTVQDEIRACAQWPRAMVPAEYLKPVKSDKPVFIISGRHDPIAGKPWGDLIARTLPNSLHIEVPGASHLPPLPGCTQELIGKFYSGMPVDQLDTGCVAKAPKPKMAV